MRGDDVLMPKRNLITVLIVVLMLMFCHAAAELIGFEPLPEQLQVLREAGRETENLLAADAYWNGDQPEAAVFLVQAGDSAQLTVLEAEADGSWRITGQNDTIPASVITSASLDFLDTTNLRSSKDRFVLTMSRYIPAKSMEERNLHQAYRSLEFQRASDGGWLLCQACEIPFESAEEGRCPYHLLAFTDGSWIYRFYEEIMDETGWPVDRSEMILQKTVPAEEMVPYTELSQFDYPAFLAFLRALAPAEYEHAPMRGNAALTPSVFPTSAPEQVPDYVYYNPLGGQYYHADPECPSVSPKYLPLVPIPFDEINSGAYKSLWPCPRCGAPKRPSPDTVTTDAPSETKAEESILRAVVPGYGDTGLTSVWILMNNAERQAFILESFPPFCYMDPNLDGDAIRIKYYPEMTENRETQEPYGESWLMTFEYTEGTWHLTSMTNGRDWTARASHGVCTFDDYHDHSGTWQWSADFETRLTDFDYAGVARLIDMYHAAMPDRPSLHGDEPGKHTDP